MKRYQQVAWNYDLNGWVQDLRQAINLPKQTKVKQNEFYIDIVWDILLSIIVENVVW